MNLIPRKLQSSSTFRKGLFCLGCLTFLTSQTALGTNTLPDHTPNITLKVKNTKVKDIIAEIENQGDYSFTYSTHSVNVNRKVSIQVEDHSIESVLDELFANEGVGYTIDNKNIVLFKEQNENPMQASKQTRKKITGFIGDRVGAIIGASIQEKGTTNGTITDANGNFTLEVASNATLKISYVGYITQFIKVNQQKTIKVELEEDTKALEEVVVM